MVPIPVSPATPDPDARTSGWGDAASLTAQQSAVGVERPPQWTPPAGPTLAGGFVAFARGEQGPGRAGDRAVVGAAAVDLRQGFIGGVVTGGRAGGPYLPGLLALREGLLLAAALGAMVGRHGRPDALMVDATGRDHPRRCGLAVHLGWALDLPSVGVTHRLLTDRRREPPRLLHRGDVEVIALAGEPAAAWVCTRDGIRPIVAHAGWRTDVATAIELALAFATTARTPEPLRQARRLARQARSEAEGR